MVPAAKSPSYVSFMAAVLLVVESEFSVQKMLKIATRCLQSEALHYIFTKLLQWPVATD